MDDEEAVERNAGIVVAAVELAAFVVVVFFRLRSVGSMFTMIPAESRLLLHGGKQRSF